MHLTFTLSQEDILQMQLFMASLSEQVRKKRRMTHLRVPIIYILLAGVLMLTSDWVVGIVFVCIAVVWYFVYPSYQARHYRKYYSKFVAENLAKRTIQPTELSFGEEYVGCLDYSGDSKLRTDTIERMDEVRDYCFLKFNSGGGMVIPLGQWSDSAAVSGELKTWAAAHQIPYHTDLDWKWQ
jgi:ABC-type multidrug transport system fused ATPase/permease subunit